MPPPPWIVAHRGDADGGLENTLAACRHAAAAGAHMLEVDVQLAAGGELVVFHDWDLRRLADRPEVVEATPWRDLERVRLRPPRRARPAEAAGAGGEDPPRLATLAALLAALPADLPLNLELKRRRAAPEALLARLAAVLGGRGRVLLSSFDRELLAAAGERLSRFPRAPIGRRDGEELLAAGEALGACSLHCHRRLASAELARRAAAAGRPLLAYTVNRPATARELFARGVAGIFSDRPGRLLAALGIPPRP